jgi:hypothetical protein
MAKAMGIRASTLFRWENNPPESFAAPSICLISDFAHSALDGGYITIAGQA